MTDDIEIGPVTKQLGSRHPFGPMDRLSPNRLIEEQQVTLATPRRKASLSARLLFTVMDRLYGEERTLPKFRVLELVARVPYQAWENVAYVTVTHTSRQVNFARRVFDTVRLARWEQDNEQWHLLILEEITQRQGRLPFIRHRVIPQILAFAYYQLSWAMYVVRPAWSYRMNADFEDHAEHEYAQLVDENPDFETTPFESRFGDDFGTYGSLAELFRQIGYDERLHKRESEIRMDQARFA